MEVENYLSSPPEEVDSTYFISLPVVFLKTQTTELVWEEYMLNYPFANYCNLEAAFRLVMIACNIMIIFKRAIMQGEINRRMATVRVQCIAIGNYMVESSRKKKMKRSAEGHRRHFLAHLLENLEVVRPPYMYSNA